MLPVKVKAEIIENVVSEVTGQEIDLYKLGWDGVNNPILPGLLESWYSVYGVDVDNDIKIQIYERYIEEIEQLIN